MAATSTLDAPRIEGVSYAPSLDELREALQAIPPTERPEPSRRADYSAREVSDLCHLSAATIRREVRLGRLEAIRDGQSFAIPVASYIMWRAARRRPAAVGGARG
ncbi:hypothetical protein [Gordonia iterans]